MYRKVKERVNRKWAFVTLSVLFGGLLVTGGGTAAIAHLATTSKEQQIAGEYLNKSEAAVKNYSVSYPVFKNEAIDRTLRNYVSHRVETFWQESANTRNDPRSFLTVNYTIVHFGQRTATVRFHEQKQRVAHPYETSDTLLTFDLQTGKQLALRDLFNNSGAEEAWVGRILHDYFQHDASEAYTASELEQYRHFSLNAIHDFSLDDDNVTLYFNPRNLASRQNSKAIAIKKDVLKPVLASTVAQPDPSRIQGAMSTPDYSITTVPVHETPIDPARNMLALTFDDGPGAYTEQVLDILRRSDAHATFFMIGRQVPRYAGVVKRVVTEGNEIGNHTWDHPNLTLLPLPVMSQQIADTQRAITQATGGYVPTLLRPPQGVYNQQVADVAHSRQLQLALWNVDTLDWLNRDTDLIYQRIMSSAADGRVILVHDIHPTTVAAVARAIPDLAAQGYQLVTWSDLKKYR